MTENLKLPWQCEDEQKWAMVALFDKLLAETDYLESELRGMMSDVVGKTKRDELNDTEAALVIARLTAMLAKKKNEKKRSAA